MKLVRTKQYQFGWLLIFPLVDLAGVGGGDRKRQPADLRRGRLRNVEWFGNRAVAWHVERRPVRHDAGRAAHRELALLREIAVDLEIRKAPWIGRRMPRAPPTFTSLAELMN